MTSTAPLYVLGDKKPPFRTLGQHLTSAEQVRKAFSTARHCRWVLVHPGKVGALFSEVQGQHASHRLLVLEELSTARRELLGSIFRDVVAPGQGVKLIPTGDLVEVLTAKHPEDYFIAGIVSHEYAHAVLFRGNLERLLVPVSWFRPSGDGTKPDFEDFEIIDCGQTVRLGKYEAGADAILYEYDKDSRRRMKERELKQDKSFGAALRRLRLQKGFSREDFGNISAKTIARIERGEVGKPHKQTLGAIAKKLGVQPEPIKTY